MWNYIICKVEHGEPDGVHIESKSTFREALNRASELFDQVRESVEDVYVDLDSSFQLCPVHEHFWWRLVDNEGRCLWSLDI